MAVDAVKESHVSVWSMRPQNIYQLTCKALHTLGASKVYQVIVVCILSIFPRDVFRFLLPGKADRTNGPSKKGKLPVVNGSTRLHVPKVLSGRDPSRFTVVLDLDETLICAYNSVGVPSYLKNMKDPRVTRFDIECNMQLHNSDGKRKSARDTCKVVVFERPGLHTFLKDLSKIADIVLFTASLEGYALPLIKTIDPDHLFCAHLYRPSTRSTEHRDHVKDLEQLGSNMGRTILLDNNPYSFCLQPLNGVPVVPFLGDPEDTQLLDNLLPLVQQLSTQEDVRPFLRERFQMPSWFESRGMPVQTPVLT